MTRRREREAHQKARPLTKAAKKSENHLLLDTLLNTVMTSHEHILWHYVRELPSYYSKAEEKKGGEQRPPASCVANLQEKKRDNLFFLKATGRKKMSIVCV